MKKKIQKTPNRKKIKYNQKTWKKLKDLRNKAIKTMEKIKQHSPRIYGSIARGDVNQESDIDIIIPNKIPSFQIETKINYQKRKIVQATPGSLIKAQIQINPKHQITFPLIKPKGNEMDFYKFGGQIKYKDLKQNKEKRVPGVNKQLKLIQPTEKGHKEQTIINREPETAKKLKIDIEIIKERIRVLKRREKIGKTGIFINKELQPNQNFEKTLKKLKKQNPTIKRKWGKPC